MSTRYIFFLFRICSNERCRSLFFVPLFLFILLFPGISLLKANRTVIKENKKETLSTEIPRLVIDTNIYDFNDIKPNSENTAEFNLTNAGNSTLIVSDVQKCCGAKTSLIKEILPGKSEVLSVQYNVGNEYGLIKKTITLTTNDPKQMQIKLIITGNVAPTLSWLPESFEITTHEKDIKCPEIKIKSLDNSKFSVKNFASSGNCLSVKLDPNYSASEIIIKPKLIAEKLKKLNTNNGSVLIELNHTDYKQIRLNFEVIPSLQATPTQFVVFNADVNEPITKSIVLQDNEKPDDSNVSSQIESVASENGTKVEMIGSSMIDKNCKLDLKITPVTKKDSEYLLKDQIVIKLKDGRTLNVPMRIFYKTETLTSKAN